MRTAHPRSTALAGLVCGLVLAVAPLHAVDVEGESSAELDIWIKLDDENTARLLLLNSWARDSERNYSERVFGVALDYKLDPAWSFRAGVRRITQESDPPGSDETRAVLDAKYFLPLGDGWLVTDRSRVDLRWIEDDGFSARFRNRVMVEKPFTIFTHDVTAFGFYELFYDTRDQAFSRQSLSIGVSLPLAKWASVDLFFTKNFAITPPKDTVGSVGLAVSLTF